MQIFAAQKDGIIPAASHESAAVGTTSQVLSEQSLGLGKTAAQWLCKPAFEWLAK